MNLTLTNDDTIINSHNLTEEELAKLPELTNLKFQNKKQFSIGESKINIHPINNTTSKISGHAQPFQDILINYSNVTEVVTADENGLFEYQLQN